MARQLSSNIDKALTATVEGLSISLPYSGATSTVLHSHHSQCYNDAEFMVMTDQNSEPGSFTPHRCRHNEGLAQDIDSGDGWYCCPYGCSKPMSQLYIAFDVFTGSKSIIRGMRSMASIGV